MSISNVLDFLFKRVIDENLSQIVPLSLCLYYREVGGKATSKWIKYFLTIGSTKVSYFSFILSNGMQVSAYHAFIIFRLNILLFSTLKYI